MHTAPPSTMHVQTLSTDSYEHQYSIGQHTHHILYDYDTHISSIVHQSEVSLGPEVRFGVLGVLAMLTMKLLHEALVSGLGEPTLLIQQRENTHGLGEGERERERGREGERNNGERKGL